MDKLFVFFVIALFTNGVFGQAPTKQTEDDLEDRYGGNPTVKPNTAPTTPTPSATTIQSVAVRQCISSCPVTSEYNPVCGTDMKTYNNPGRLICAQMCGVKVSVLRHSRCPPVVAQ